MTNKQERGAIMLEVLAVLALIGVMGPMLYKQVLSRNQEISNVNIAAEMRAIKEAMSAAIAADSAILAELCKEGSTEAGLTSCSTGDATFQTAVEEFLPIGMDGILDPDYGYTVKLYSQKVILQNGEDYPILVGVVAGRDLASDWNFKRTARIANLIGTDGGIVQNGALVGAGGSWNLSNDIAADLAGELNVDISYPIVVATTAMDTFDPDLGATDPNAVSVPGSLAFSYLHAWNYFSVGDKGPTDPGRCFKLSRTVDDDGAGSGDVTKPDGIFHVGDPNADDGDLTKNCDPLFWVGTKGGAGDNSTAGQVYVKNNLYVGRDNAGNKQAFAFEVQNSQDHEGTNVDNSRIVVYNVDGDDTLTIDATGKIVSDKTVTVGGTKNADGTITGGTEYNYGLDPANTSVLNDVRLAARGGARLSDILPNYISKGMYQLSSTATGSNQSWSTEIKKPACPENYVAAVIVTPLKWGASAVQSITVPANSSHSLTAPSGGGDVTGTINAVTVPKANITQYALAIEITGGSGADNRTDSPSETPWTVKMGYKNDSGSWDGNLKNGEIQALAQTYCVYAPSDTTYDPNALTDETKIPDSLKK